MSTTDKKILLESKEQLVKENKRYVVRIPWNEKKGQLISNASMATRRLQMLGNRFNKDDQLKKEYQNIISDYLKKEYIREVPNNEKWKTKWLLPHFPVIRRDKETTKVRIVFDGAAKSQGNCLNDAINCGPKLQGDLIKILLRFRKESIALVCDISEMYLQIKVNEADRCFLRFLWKEDGKKENMFEFKRLVFGLNASPFLAQLVVKENAELFKNKFPRAVEAIQQSTYMDDCLDSVSTEKEAMELQKQLIQIWEEAGMSAKKWLTNNESVNKSIPNNEKSPQLQFQDEKDIKIKTLGICWEATTDIFTFSANKVVDEIITKRRFLSLIAQIFDPLGLIAPVVVAGKIFMQQLWIKNLSWDEKIDDELLPKIKNWTWDCQELTKVKIPRCLNPTSPNPIQIHIFTDASIEAYGAVAYARSGTFKNRTVRIVAAKSKVAPIKSRSIPRLELMAACVGVSLGEIVTKALSLNLYEVQFWCDSQDVLWWITQPGRCFKTFIAHRVGTIQEKTRTSQWQYISSKENPADLLSRGTSARMCAESMLWWEGPEFLKKNKNEWPVSRWNKMKKLENDQEQAEDEKLKCFTGQINTIENCLDPKNYSNLQKLLRVTAWIQRFLKNSKQLNKSKRETGELSVNELKEVEIKLIRQEQKNEFFEEYDMLIQGKNVKSNSRIWKLKPILDSENLIRADSRLVNAEFLSMEEKYPIIMSERSWLTRLFVRQEHINGRHYAGTQHVLNNLRKRFWIPKARRLIQQEERQCGSCKKAKAKGMTTIMAPIPSFRLSEPFRVFSKIGVDFAGPFFTKQGRGKSQSKRYACLFTCLQIRAVHIEMATGLDADSFLMAFKRFVARRGTPEIVISDNGTNFWGAVNNIKEFEFTNFKIQRKLSNERIQWIFNPPSAPHFGGMYESMIKSMKRAMARILTNASINDEELMTVLIEAEGLINSRPISIQSEMDPHEGKALTPNDFLIGLGDQNCQLTSKKENVQYRWRRMQELISQLWKRWMNEVVPLWSMRQKWLEEKNPIEKGDIVWILDRTNERGSWPLGKVEECYPGTDSIVRVVRLVSEGKECVRAINRLCRITREINEKNVSLTMNGQRRGEYGQTHCFDKAVKINTLPR